LLLYFVFVKIVPELELEQKQAVALLREAATNIMGTLDALSGFSVLKG
jgi:hypothetical protein